MTEEMLTLSCVGCGVGFQRLARKERYRTKTGRKAGPFCGRACTGRAVAEANISGWRQDHARSVVAMVCEKCGKEFSRTSDTVGARVFCSRRCSDGRQQKAWPDARSRFAASWRIGELPGVPGMGHCWEWTGAKSSSGHANIYADGKLIGAHRFSFQLAHGRSVRRGWDVHHKCINPSCVNPEHLEEMSRSEHRKFHCARAKLSR